MQATTAICIGVTAAIALPAIMGEDFATREAAKLYAPLDGLLYGEGSRDRISTVIIDDNSLAQAGQSWPADYSFYGRLLRGIAYYHPRAIFLDIILASQREDPSIDRLTDTLCRLHEHGIRVYLAGLRDPSAGLALRPELQRIAGTCFEAVAVDYRPDEVDRLTWTYDLAYRQPGQNVKSAALAIYDDVSGSSLPVPTSPMALSWGGTPAIQGLRWESSSGASTTSPVREAPNPYCRNPHGLLELLPPGVQQVFHRDAPKPLCVFHSTVYAHDLANATRKDDAELSRNLAGRIVMVGTSRSYTNDLVTSPLHDRLPGVYLHAMALDNLLTYGGNYKRAVGFKLSADSDHRHLLELALIGLPFMVAIRLLHQKFDSKLTRRLQRKPLYLSPPPEIYLVDATGHVEQYRKRNTRHATDPNAATGPVTSRKTRRHKSMHAGTRFLTKAVGSVCVVTVLLLIGEHILNIGYFSVISVAAFSLAAEWFEWNEKLLGWLFPNDRKQTNNDH